jgi:hypothetical protein
MFDFSVYQQKGHVKWRRRHSVYNLLESCCYRHHSKRMKLKSKPTVHAGKSFVAGFWGFRNGCSRELLFGIRLHISLASYSRGTESCLGRDVVLGTTVMIGKCTAQDTEFSGLFQRRNAHYSHISDHFSLEVSLGPKLKLNISLFSDEFIFIWNVL